MALLLTVWPPARLSAQTFAITGGTVYPVSGPKLDGATVVIREGRIVAVGRDVAVPAGATVIDAAGKWITPGFVHAWTDLGLVEVGSVGATRENNKEGDIDAAFNVAEGVNPQSVMIPVARTDGVTTALTVPSGGLIAGQAVMLDLAGDRMEDLVVRSPAAMVIDLSQQSKSAGGGSRAGVLQRLRQVFRDAAEYRRRTADFRRNQIQPLSAPAADLEALQPVLDGQLPVLAIADRESDIESALRLGAEFHLKLAIEGATEGWRVARELAQAGVPVIVNPLADVPSFDGLAPRLDNATLLREAGARVVLVATDENNYRNLRFSAGNAVRNGMAWDDALRAITLEPARALGVEDRYGSLEPGKVANVVVWSGDPLDFAGQAEHIFIHGREITTRTRQTELLERYRTLPPKY
jgi:imidazolonepropionase-like amidohydrolase